MKHENWKLKPPRSIADSVFILLNRKMKQAITQVTRRNLQDSILRIAALADLMKLIAYHLFDHVPEMWLPFPRDVDEWAQTMNRTILEWQTDGMISNKRARQCCEDLDQIFKGLYDASHAMKDEWVEQGMLECDEDLDDFEDDFEEDLEEEDDDAEHDEEEQLGPDMEC